MICDSSLGRLAIVTGGPGAFEFIINSAGVGTCVLDIECVKATPGIVCVIDGDDVGKLCVKPSLDLVASLEIGWFIEFPTELVANVHVGVASEMCSLLLTVLNFTFATDCTANA